MEKLYGIMKNWFYRRQQQMEAVGGAVQEGRAVRGRHGVRGRVAPVRRRRGAAQLVPREGQLRVLLRLPLPGILYSPLSFSLLIYRKTCS